MPSIDVSAVIVSFNTRALLERCLDSLPAAAAPFSCEAIVVDNGSDDGSIAMIRERFPHVQLVERPDNPGFARSTNLGLERACGRVRVWLNPDCLPSPGSLALLVEHLDLHPETGAVGPRLLYPDGRVQPSAQRFPNASLVFYRFLGLGRVARGRLFGWLWRAVGRSASATARAYFESIEQAGPARSVDWITGACLATRAEDCRRIGPLDEGYFMYCEDADWCQRVHTAGLQVHYLPQAIVVHHVGASGATNPLIAYHSYRSLLRYFLRYRPAQFGPLRVLMLFAFGLRGAGNELARLSGRPATHPWWKLAALCWSPRALEERGA